MLTPFKPCHLHTIVPGSVFKEAQLHNWHKLSKNHYESVNIWNGFYFSFYLSHWIKICKFYVECVLPRNFFFELIFLFLCCCVFEWIPNYLHCRYTYKTQSQTNVSCHLLTAITGCYARTATTRSAALGYLAALMRTPNSFADVTKFRPEGNMQMMEFIAVCASKFDSFCYV